MKRFLKRREGFRQGTPEKERKKLRTTAQLLAYSAGGLVKPGCGGFWDERLSNFLRIKAMSNHRNEQRYPKVKSSAEVTEQS
ncbi:hypothetical protein [Pseudomonas sp. PGPR40]|uniref:hypothetical protein n=1 Tax=Pseudomonas sp. PGPR40 TaxID=2913476 RepID=UPI001EDA996E|nr:hypothetical protein [Pseudomonas sp. PGPR40]